jgi:propanediol dehydratase small subunit
MSYVSCEKTVDAVHVCTQQLQAAAATAAEAGYSGLAAALEDVAGVLLALPAPHGKRIAEALTPRNAARESAATARGTRR